MKAVRVRRTGFTLVELLVVIAIITVLIAIGLPVMMRAREKARQAVCISNLHSLGMALRMYRLEEGGFPGPYDPVIGAGGFNALYPTYLDNRKSLICPDDPIEDGKTYAEQGAFHLRSADGTQDLFLTDPTATLLIQARQMYDPPDGGYYPGTRQPYPGCNWLNPTWFGEHYSSYNMLYNWLGYIWWQPDPSKSIEQGRYEAYVPIPLPGVAGGTGGNQRVNWADNIAFWYRWVFWDPEGKFGVVRPTADAPGNDKFAFVNDVLPYSLAQQIYWFSYNPEDQTAGELVNPYDPNDHRRYPLQDSLQRPLWDWYGTDDASLSLLPYHAADAAHNYDVGLPSGVFPGLINRNAPENTIVTRCPYHRPYTTTVKPPERRTATAQGTAGERGRGRGRRGGGAPTVTYEQANRGADIVLRLDGTAEIIAGPPQYEYQWAEQPRLTH